jgi:hypothetical protein
MKSNRPVGPAKPSLRIPVAALSTEHLSALAAFERWQRESPQAEALTPAEERIGNATNADRQAKN